MKLLPLLFLATGFAFAQAPPTVSSALERELTMVETNVVNSASAMPEDKFNFTPESLNIPGANYKGVYTFAGLVKHVAAANFMIWAPAAGEKPPAGVTDTKGPASLTSKAEIIQFLKDSFAMGHKAVQAMTAENSAEVLPNKQPRIYTTTFAMIHAYDEYGQIDEYLRMNGIVPPASQPKK